MSKCKYCIVASVLLNLLLAGVMLGQFMHRDGNPREERMMQLLDQADLSAEKRVELQAKVRSLSNRDDESRKTSRQAREETLKLLVAEPFDAEAYERKLTEMFALRGEQREEIAHSITEIAKELKQKDRIKLADILRSPPDRRRDNQPGAK